MRTLAQKSPGRKVAGRTPLNRQAVAVAVTVLALLVACDSATRNEPTPGEMCEELVDSCEGLLDERSELCFDVGRAGVKDSSKEDQCFAFYPSCIDDCLFLSGSRPSSRADAGDEPSDAGEAPAQADAAASDASD